MDSFAAVDSEALSDTECDGLAAEAEAEAEAEAVAEEEADRLHGAIEAEESDREEAARSEALEGGGPAPGFELRPQDAGPLFPGDPGPQLDFWPTEMKAGP
jgi:hypothetical protein